MLRVRDFALLSLGPALARADLLSNQYVSPTDLTSAESHVVEAWQNFTATLEGFLGNDTDGLDPRLSLEESTLLATLTNVTFSVGMFSLADPHAAEEFQFHHTSEEVATSDVGTNKVDGCSIYRTQSISKVFGALGALLNLHKSDWHRPLSDIFPELATKSYETGEQPPIPVDWDEITPYTLAAQLSGLPLSSIPVGTDVFLQLAAGLVTEEEFLATGLPPLSEDAPVLSFPCLALQQEGCGEDAGGLVSTVARQPTLYRSFVAPKYSNIGYVMFGGVIQRLTGRRLDDLLTESILDPLEMKNTRVRGLNETEISNAVVPGSRPELVNGTMDALLSRGSGGVLSTLEDLAKFGIGIMNSTLLEPRQTRQWLKPLSFTTHLDQAVGMPWEIVRYTDPSTGVVTNIFSKSGDGGEASSSLLLLPDLGVGFTYLSVASDALLGDPLARVMISGAVQNLLIKTIMPSLASQAAAETEARYGGTYVSTVDGLNSSLTVAVNTTAGAPTGLMVTEFISNGTTVSDLPTFQGRLVPVNYEGNKTFMRGIGIDDTPATERELFSKFYASDWIIAGSQSYGGLPTNLFVFEADDSGKTVTVSPVAYRVELERQEE